MLYTLAPMNGLLQVRCLFIYTRSYLIELAQPTENSSNNFHQEYHTNIRPTLSRPRTSIEVIESTNESWNKIKRFYIHDK